MSDGATAQTQQPRFLRTFLTFALIAPVIAGVVPSLVLFLLFLLPLMIKLHGLENLSVLLLVASTNLAIGVLFAIIIAFPPAMISGIVIAVWERMHGRTGVWLPIAASFFGSIAAAVVYWWLFDWSSIEETWAISIALVAGSIFASFVCWRLVRPRLKEVERAV
jgi:hypothetical protein